MDISTGKTFGFLALAAAGLASVVLLLRDGREHPATQPPSPPQGKALPAGKPRPWPLESLPELSFDEALTLLSSEVARHAKEPSTGSRIETVAARLVELHGENLKKIEKASPYYESKTPEIRARFAAFRAEYGRRYRALQDGLTALRAGGGNAGQKIQKLIRDSGALRPPRQVPAAKDLPRRRLFTEHREPRATPEEWKAGPKVGTAPKEAERDAWERIFGIRAAHAQAAEEDLGETPEVKFTAASAPAIQRLLDEEGLRGSPAKITNWVRNHIEFVPIWGALQNSVTCLETRKGTAMDLASLTIALLRASGIRARYQAGTVRLPIEEARNWLGNFESATAAASLLASGGTGAVVQVDVEANPVALRFEHVWVRAFVDYIPHQGACHVEGDTWVDLDMSIKNYQFVELPDLSPSFREDDAERLLQGYFGATTLDEETGAITLPDMVFLRDSFARLRAAAPDFLLQLEATHGPVQKREILGRGKIRKSIQGTISPAPPFEVLARGWERPELTDAERFGLEIVLEGKGSRILSYQLPAPGLGKSHLTLAFRPETELDGGLLAGQLPVDPAGILPEGALVAGVRMVPELIRNGAPVASGGTVDMGTPLSLAVLYLEPVLKTAPVRKPIVAGETVAIGLDLVSVPPGLFEPFLEDISSALTWLETPQGAGDGSFDPNRFAQAMLSMVVHLWFGETDLINAGLGSAMGCPTYRYPSVGFCSDRWISDSLFGLPFALSPEGVTLDIPGDLNLLISRAGDVSRMATANFFMGLIGSGMEAFVPMEVFNANESRRTHSYWLGSSLALLSAWRIGDSVAVVSQENLDRVLPKLNLHGAEIEEIREAVDRGLTVITALNEITVGEQCLSGYILRDLLTGNAVFRMSGSICGGSPLNCALEKLPGSSWFKSTLKGSIGLINLWGHAAKGMVEKVLKDDWSAEGMGKAFKVLMDYVRSWIEGVRTNPENEERDASWAQTMEVAVLLHAYHVMEAAVLAQLCIATSEGKCVLRENSLPSLWMGWTYEINLRFLRDEATLKATEIGLGVPCSCFCLPDCDSNLFDVKEWCSKY